MGGQRGEERVGELGHQHVHVNEGVHLHGHGRVVALAAEAAPVAGHLLVLTMGHTEAFCESVPKQGILLLRPLRPEPRHKRRSGKTAYA